VPTAAASAPAVLPGAVKIVGTQEALTTIENDVARATFSNRGAVLTSFVLRKHTDDQKRPLELVRGLPDPSTKPLAVLFPGNLELTRLASGALYAVEKGPARTLTFRYGDERLSVEKEIRLGDGYLFDVEVSVAGPEFTVLVGTGLRNPTAGERESRYVMPATAVATAGNGLERIAAGKLTKEERWPLPAGGFVGIEDNYFLAAIAPRQPAAARFFPFPLPAGDPSAKPDALVSGGVSASGTLNARVFFGPKDVAILESAGGKS